MTAPSPAVSFLVIQGRCVPGRGVLQRAPAACEPPLSPKGRKTPPIVAFPLTSAFRVPRSAFGRLPPAPGDGPTGARLGVGPGRGFAPLATGVRMRSPHVILGWRAALAACRSCIRLCSAPTPGCAWSAPAPGGGGRQAAARGGAGRGPPNGLGRSAPGRGSRTACARPVSGRAAAARTACGVYPGNPDPTGAPCHPRWRWQSAGR